MPCNACDVAVCADRRWPSSTWLRGVMGRVMGRRKDQAFLPELEAKRWECTANRIVDLHLVVGCDNIAPLFFFPH